MAEPNTGAYNDLLPYSDALLDWPATYDNETPWNSVPVSPNGTTNVITLIDPANTIFRYNSEIVDHEDIGCINYIHQMIEPSSTSNVGENMDALTDSSHTRNDAAEAQAVCIKNDREGIPPSILVSPQYSLYRGCTTSNVDTTPDRPNTRVKFKKTVNPDVFKDFPKNGVCLKHRGTRGISQVYRERRNALFRQMKCGRTKHGVKFPNELLQTEIIEHLLTSLKLVKIRFFAMIKGELLEFSTDDEIFDAIRADFGTNTDNYSDNSTNSAESKQKKLKIYEKEKQPPMKNLVDFFQSNRIELDAAIDIDPGKKMIYQGAMQRIYDASLRRILDESWEAELYDWCEKTYAYFFKHEITWVGDFVPKFPTTISLMESTRLLLKQNVGNPCKVLIFEGILNDIGYAAFNEILTMETKTQLHVWVEITWNYFFENGADKKRKAPPGFVHDQGDSINDNGSAILATINTSNITSPLTSTATTNTKSRATTTTSSSMNTISSGTSESPDSRNDSVGHTISLRPFSLPDGRTMDAKNTLQSFAALPMTPQRLAMDAANTKFPVVAGTEETKSPQHLYNLTNDSPQNAVLLSESISSGSYGTTHSERTNAMNTVASNATPLSNTDLTDGTDDVIHAHAVVVHSVIVAEGDVLKEPSQVTKQEPTQRLKSDFRGYYCWFRGIWWRLKRKCTTTVLKRSK